MHTRQVFSLLLLFLLIVSPLAAQKQYKTLKTYIKASNGSSALTEVKKLEADTSLSSDPRLYAYGVQANTLLADEQNKKMYLKQTADTASLFSAILGIFTYALRCDSAERLAAAQPDKKVYKYQYRRDHGTRLLAAYPNLGAGARYYYQKADYTTALSYYKMYFRAYGAPILEGRTPDVQEQQLYSYAFFALKSAFLIEDYALVDTFANLALLDTVRGASTLEILARTAGATGDSLLYLQRLKKGLDKYPTSFYFFTRLADNIARNGHPEEALALADSLLEAVDSTCSFYLMGRTRSLFDLARYDEALATLERMPEDKKSTPGVLYYTGASYCNKAGLIEMPQNIHSKEGNAALAEIKELYEKARPYLEAYRKAEPDHVDRWGPLLYRIYLFLNMGTEFDEIDVLLKAQ